MKDGRFTVRSTLLVRTIAMLLCGTTGCSMLLVKGPDPANAAAECTQESGVPIADVLLAVMGAGAAVAGVVLVNNASSSNSSCNDAGSGCSGRLGDNLAGYSLLGVGGLMAIFHGVSAGVGYGRVRACRSAKASAAPIALSHALFDYRGALAAPPSVSRTADEARRAAESALVSAKAGASLETLSASAANAPTRSLAQWLQQPRLRRAIAGLQPGEASDILETPFGYLIVRRGW
jgi:hypothetical protein